MRFRIRSSPACSDRCRCGINRGSSAKQPPQLIIDLDRVERGEPQALELRHRGEQPADHLPEARPPRQIGAVSGQIDPGQDDLAIAGGDETARLIGDETHRHRAAGPAGIGDDAEGAAMVAALLDLQKGAGPALETVDRMGRGLAEIRAASSGLCREVAARPQLGAVVQHAVDFGQGRVSLRSDLGGAAGDDDLGLGMLAGGPGGSPGAPDARPRRSPRRC